MIPHIVLDWITIAILANIWFGYFLSLSLIESPPTALPMLAIIGVFLIIKLFTIRVFYSIYSSFMKEKENTFKINCLI